MPASTPKYALPYPLGTDRVADGDNDIKALAERVEGVMGATQLWPVNRGTTDGFPANTWTQLLSVAPNVPVGAIVAVSGVANLRSSAVAILFARLTSVGMTSIPGTHQAAKNPTRVNEYFFLPILGAFVATAATNTITLEGQGSAGSITVDGSTQLMAWRIS